MIPPARGMEPAGAAALSKTGIPVRAVMEPGMPTAVKVAKAAKVAKVARTKASVKEMAAALTTTIIDPEETLTITVKAGLRTTAAEKAAVEEEIIIISSLPARKSIIRRRKLSFAVR